MGLRKILRVIRGPVGPVGALRSGSYTFSCWTECSDIWGAFVFRFPPGLEILRATHRKDRGFHLRRKRSGQATPRSIWSE